MSEEKTIRRGGPEECPCGPCSECIGGPHHFSDAMLEDAFTNDKGEHHEAVKLGVECWYQCKHCDGWKEYDFDEELDDEEGEC